MSILISVDTTSRRPLYRQIVDRISAMAASGNLKPGTRLPPSRDLAQKLGVNRSTVYRAYQELWAMGYLESRPGSYTTLRRRPPIAPRSGGTGCSMLDWASHSTRGARRVDACHRKEARLLEQAALPGIISFIPLSPDPRLIPTEDFRRCMNTVLVNNGATLLQYGDPLGYRPLRELIAERMAEHCIAVDPEGIMVTTGAQNAMELLLHLLAPSGSRVVVEAPTYSRMIDLLNLHGVSIQEVPMKNDGMDLDDLERVVAPRPPAFIYTMTNFHNPTGITTCQAHRERLLEICRQYAVPLVEDGFEEEMKYFGKAILPVKSMDRHHLVLYVGTFSKVLFPGLRIGWVAADPRCIRRLVPLQKTAILSGNLLDQAALHNFCRQGYYDRHLKRIHRLYRRRMQCLLESLETHMDPARVAWQPPFGGYLAWMRIREPTISEDLIWRHFLHHGVALLPGSTHFASRPEGVFFRLSIAHLDEPAIKAGVQRMAKALATLPESEK